MRWRHLTYEELIRHAERRIDRCEPLPVDLVAELARRGIAAPDPTIHEGDDD